MFELVPLQVLQRCTWFLDPMDLAWPACWGLRMQRETSSGGEMAVLCETNLPLPRQLPNPLCIRGENLLLAVHLSALLLCLVQVGKGTQRCSCSPVLLSCRKRPTEIQKPGKERLCLQSALILQCLKEAFFAGATGHPKRVWAGMFLQKRICAVRRDRSSAAFRLC